MRATVRPTCAWADPSVETPELEATTPLVEPGEIEEFEFDDDEVVDDAEEGAPHVCMG